MSRASVPFAEAVEDVSRGNPKLPQSEFSVAGAYPVIDQGQSVVAGYTDDQSLLCQAPGPVIVFGDHTRAFKYVDHPFVVGADGVKVLRVREGWHPKFVYHFLRSHRLPAAGYSRHFKFLKQVDVPRPPLHEQRRVAALLDGVEAQRTIRAQVSDYLDDLTQAIFVDLQDGQPVFLVSAGELMPTMRNGLSPATAGVYPADVLTLSAVTKGVFDPTSVKQGRFAVDPPADKRVSSLDFLICRGNGNKALVGVGVCAPEDRPDLVFPDTVIAGRVDADKITMPFLETAWRQPEVRRQIEMVARTTNGTHKVNQQTLSSVQVRVLPLDRQREFDSRVELVRAVRAANQRALDLEHQLLSSLQARLFQGEL